MSGQFFVCGQPEIDQALPTFSRDDIASAPVDDVLRHDIAAHQARDSGGRGLFGGVFYDLLMVTHSTDIALSYRNVKAYRYAWFAMAAA